MLTPPILDSTLICIQIRARNSAPEFQSSALTHPNQVKEKRLRLETVRSHRDTAVKHQEEMERAESDILDSEEKICNLDQQIQVN